MRYAQAHGWLQVFGNHARLLVEEAIAPEDLDATSLKEQLSDAERAFRSPRRAAPPRGGPKKTRSVRRHSSL